MSERQYSEEEVAAIFERASKADQTGPSLPAQGKGVTLAALQEIGREVGISPESITLAAQSLDQLGQPAQQNILGLPVGVGQSVELDRPFTDEDWELLVAHMRTTFNARGTIRYDGPFRQWTNGNLQALVEPTANGHRIRIQSYSTDARVMILGGTFITGLAAATFIGAALTGTLANTGAAPGSAMLAMFGLSILTGGALRVRNWARRRKAQFEDILARISQAARK